MTPAKKKLHRQIAKEWRAFRKRYIFSQPDLARTLGISRRTVQYAESGNSQNPDWPCIPKPETLAKFRALKMKYESEAK